MRRLLIPFLAAAILLSLPATGSAAFITAIGDQRESTFSSPFYQRLQLKKVRFIAPYDAATKANFARDEVDNYMRAAKANQQEVLVHFSHSRVSGQQKKLPSVKAYTSAVKKFLKRWPTKTVGVWNEANHCSQPTCNNPKRAAEYFLAMKKVCKGCKIVAVDLLDAANIKPTLRYLAKWKKFAKKGNPKIYGFHNYSDTNRFSSSRTKALLKATGKGEVWLTETGGVVSFGTNFPRDEQRAAEALTFMFKLAKLNKRIKRLYIYNWTANEGGRFDAGLVDAQGQPRPGYEVVRKQLRK